jgi:DNA-binding NarL/FixJ family response regulator
MDMPVKSIRVAIVEDQELMAAGLGLWVASQRGIEMVGCAHDGNKGLTMCLAARPDLVLLDIDLPGMDGMELAERLATELPGVRLLAMSGLTDPHTIWRVSRSRVHGYLEKTAGPDLLLEAIQTVAGGGVFYSALFAQVKRECLSHPEAFQKLLSGREQEVLRRMACGWDEARIGQELEISPATVGAHRKHIRQKLGLHSDRELLAYARKWGLDSTRLCGAG